LLREFWVSSTIEFGTSSKDQHVKTMHLIIHPSFPEIVLEGPHVEMGKVPQLTHWHPLIQSSNPSIAGTFIVVRAVFPHYLFELFPKGSDVIRTGHYVALAVEFPLVNF
jgi:hypothetical protein